MMIFPALQKADPLGLDAINVAGGCKASTNEAAASTTVSRISTANHRPCTVYRSKIATFLAIWRDLVANPG
ncbi:hypothetical protein CDQ92_15935 [Sphingopyxis bauzanensis]|uniref:Uncharacterized protein n=1 Tax=Sphingopyxis bauzanensis TaxID=651663 RepID=A0A246JP32_9SPHN|nr:hypothetical protein [Sphingopyxis bauzanensis]OWQ94572.1 hypothetical protein CDQ92_15935 [Sphingopyxis bauzanensis]